MSDSQTPSSAEPSGNSVDVEDNIQGSTTTQSGDNNNNERANPLHDPDSKDEDSLSSTQARRPSTSKQGFFRSAFGWFSGGSSTKENVADWKRKTEAEKEEEVGDKEIDGENSPSPLPLPSSLSSVGFIVVQLDDKDLWKCLFVCMSLYQYMSTSFTIIVIEEIFKRSQYRISLSLEE